MIKKLYLPIFCTLSALVISGCASYAIKDGETPAVIVKPANATRIEILPPVNFKCFLKSPPGKNFKSFRTLRS